MTRQAFSVLLLSALFWTLSILLEIQAFAVLAAFGLGCEVVSFLLLLNAGRQLPVRRTLARMVRQGDTLRMTLSLASARGSSHGALLIRDQNPVAGPAGAPVIWVSGLRGGQEVLLSYECPAAIRGDHALAWVQVTCSDPLGFFVRARRLACPGRVLVLPRWERVTLLPFNSRQRSYLVGIERATVEGEGQEFFGIREYRHGDSMRSVHWASSARARRPMVRQFENETRPNISLFVDTAPISADAVRARLQLDRSAAIAASLAMHALDAGSRVSCAAAGQATLGLPLQGGESQRHDLLRFLAGLQPGRKVPTSQALGHAVGRLRGGDVLVAVLGTLDAATAAALSSFAYRGGSAVVFLAGGRVESKARRFWQRRPAPGAAPAEVAKYGQGLRALGVPVIRAEEEGSLNRSIQAWLR